MLTIFEECDFCKIPEDSTIYLLNLMQPKVTSIYKKTKKFTFPGFS